MQVPIVKLTDRETLVKVDISFNADTGVTSAALIEVREREGEIETRRGDPNVVTDGEFVLSGV